MNDNDDEVRSEKKTDRQTHWQDS